MTDENDRMLVTTEKLTVHMLLSKWLKCLGLLSTPWVFDIWVKIFDPRRQGNLIHDIFVTRKLRLEVYDAFAV